MSEAPRGRGRGRGRGGGRGRRGAAAGAGAGEGGPTVLQPVDKEIADLLVQSGLHLKRQRTDDGKSPRGAAAKKSATSPHDIDTRKPVHAAFTAPVEDLIDAYARDVQLCGEATSRVSHLNSAGPQRTLDALKNNPVENWRDWGSLWRDLWKSTAVHNEAALFDKVCKAMTEDIKDFKEVTHKLHSFKKHRKVKSSSTRSSESVVSILESRLAEGKDALSSKNFSSGKPFFWASTDGADFETVYTDSDDDQSAVPPAAALLRRTVRAVKRKEQLRTVIARSFRAFEITQDLKEIVKDNVETLEAAFHSAAGRASRDARRRWRLWRAAAEAPRWHLASAPEAPLARFHPASPLVRAFRNACAAQCPHWVLGENGATFAPYRQLSPTDIWLPPAQQSGAAAETPRPLPVVDGPPLLRCYFGHLHSLIGDAGRGLAYRHSSAFPVEFVELLRNSARGPWRPLRAQPNLHRRAQIKRQGAAAGGATSAEGAAVSAGVAAAAAWGSAALRILGEADSAESEEEGGDGGAAGGAADGGSGGGTAGGAAGASGAAASGAFPLLGYAHDNDVMTLGKFGKLRNRFTNVSRVRKRLAASSGAAAGENRSYWEREVEVSDFSSSEDSGCGLIEDEHTHRLAARTTRKLIAKQRQRVAAAGAAAGAGAAVSPESRPVRLLRALFEAGHGPLRAAPKDVPPPQKWPGSPLPPATPPAPPVEEKWTVLTKKKPRIRRFDNRAALALAEGSVFEEPPDGFMGLAIDPGTGAETQIAAVDEARFFSVHGDCKALRQSLGATHAEALRDTREYVVIIPNAADARDPVTVLPAAPLALIWTHSPRQNLRRVHVYLSVRAWLTSRYRRRIYQKFLGYAKIARQGCYAWQHDLDRLAQISERQMELAAFSHAKFVQPRTRSFSARRQLDTMGRATLITVADPEDGRVWPVDAAKPEEADALGPNLAATAPEAAAAATAAVGDGGTEAAASAAAVAGAAGGVPQLASVAEIPASPGAAESCAEFEALRARAEAEFFFEKYAYRCAFRVRAGSAAFAFGRPVRTRWADLLVKRYAPLVTQQYAAFLPSFKAAYSEVRAQMAKRAQAEVDFAAAKRRFQRAATGNE